MKNLASKNVDLNIKPLCVNEAINKLAGIFTQIQQTLDSIEIHDAGYSKEFWEEVENALITVAVIKAFGIGKKSERYLGVVKKVVKKNKLPRVTFITHGNLNEKEFIELLGKYQ